MVRTRKGSVTSPTPARPRAAPGSTPRKSKNRVAETAISSPRIKPVPAPSLPAVSIDSEDESTGSRPGLPDHLLKQLLTDIEGDGGIGTFINKANRRSVEQKLSRLCDNNEDLYGKKGQYLRSQIQKKVYRWKVKYEEGVYESEVLNKYRVLSAANLKKKEAELKRQETKKPAAKKPAAKKLEFESDDSVSSIEGPSNSGSSISSGSTRAPPSIQRTKRRKKLDQKPAASVSFLPSLIRIKFPRLR